MVSVQLDEIFAQTLSGGYDDDAPWAAVRTLHSMGSREVFDYAAEWCSSQNPLKCARAADVPAQLGRTADHPSNNFPAFELNEEIAPLDDFRRIAKYLEQAVRVRDTIAFSYQHGGAPLLDFVSTQGEYRAVQLAYVNLVGSYLTAAAPLNMAVGREVNP